jgi:hypothetical protein
MEVLFYISPGKILDDVGESQELVNSYYFKKKI